MVHCSIANSYNTTTDAAKDCDIDQGSIDHHKVGIFTWWRKCSWYEPNSDAVNKLDTPIARP